MVDPLDIGKDFQIINVEKKCKDLKQQNGVKYIAIVQNVNLNLLVSL